MIGVTDSKQLFDSIKSTKQFSEHRLGMDMTVIQESMFKYDVDMKWTTTQKQLSDCLTKNLADSKMLCVAVETGDNSQFEFRFSMYCICNHDFIFPVANRFSYFSHVHLQKSHCYHDL
jgi:hypothetical protein